MRIFRRLMGIFGLLLIIVGVGAIYYWETQGREKFSYTEVVVASSDIQSGTILTEEMIGIISVDRKSLGTDYKTAENVSEILGQITLVNIPKGTILTSTFTETSELVPKADESVLKVPSEWIVSFPSTLRRGDKLYVYPYKSDKKEGKVFIEELRVVYAKDSGYKEVVDSRYEGDRGVSSFEVLVTVNQLNNLQDWVSKGYKFIFSYK